uniref:Addiction module toxin, HicA family n=1 Tax=Mesocestoides corti TaxID=53468 RepID=A0A5K3FUS3_MESCO
MKQKEMEWLCSQGYLKIHSSNSRKPEAVRTSKYLAELPRDCLHLNTNQVCNDLQKCP